MASAFTRTEVCFQVERKGQVRTFTDLQPVLHKIIGYGRNTDLKLSKLIIYKVNVLHMLTKTKL